MKTISFGTGFLFSVICCLAQPIGLRNPAWVAQLRSVAADTRTNALTPTFSPNGGPTATGTNVTILYPGAGSNTITLVWTTNGSTPITNTWPPDGTSSNYGGICPQVVTNMPAGTLKALAWTNDAYTLASSVATATFTNAPAPVCAASNAPTYSYTGGAPDYVGNTDSYYYSGNIWTNLQSQTICALAGYIKDFVGDPTARTLHMGVWSLVAGGTNLNTELGGVDLGLCNKGTNWLYGSLSNSVALTIGTTYALVYTLNGTDAANYITILSAAGRTNTVYCTWKANKNMNYGPTAGAAWDMKIYMQQ